MAENNRETRRRRIVDRGSDRFALIMGQIKTMPQAASDTLGGELVPNLQTSLPCADRHITSVSPDHEDNISDPSSMKQDSVSYPTHSDVNNVGMSLDSGKDQMLNPPKSDSIERAAHSSSSVATNLQDSKDATLSNPSIDATRAAQKPHCQSLGFMHFSSTELSSAIVGSQKTRLSCSIAVAVVVILSHIGFPFLGGKLMKRTIISGPVYLILFTNITTVIARFLSKKQADSNRPAKRGSEFLQDYGNDWAAQVGRTLEAGLLMRSVADAVFMDFGVYAVTVICGLSLVQTIGRTLLV